MKRLGVYKLFILLLIFNNLLANSDFNKGIELYAEGKEIKGIEYLLKAHKAGYVDATCTLGMLGENYNKFSIKQTRDYIIEALKKGSSDCKVQYAMSYSMAYLTKANKYSWIVSPKHFVRALSFLIQASENGNSDASQILVALTQNGYGEYIKVIKNPTPKILNKLEKFEKLKYYETR